MLIKQKFITSQKLGSRDFWWIKGISAIPPLFNGTEVLSSASDKTNLFAKIFSKNSNVDDSSIFLPTFLSRTNLKLHNIQVTPKQVKVIINFELSKVSGLYYISAVVLQKCEHDLSCILAELFNLCLKESCLKVSSVIPV